MKTTALVQARLGSSRLPRKVLADIAGRPALERVVDRVASAQSVGEVVVVVPETPEDGPLRAFCTDRGIRWFAGAEIDVLDRFKRGADAVGAELVVRVTADCPLIDPDVIDALLDLYAADPAVAYAAVATGALAGRPGLRRYPHGLDAEVFHAETLAAAWREAVDPYEREHVTPFVWRRPDRFRPALLQAPEDWGDERWTVDHPTDLDFVRMVYERLEDDRSGVLAVMALLEAVPELRELNAGARAGATPLEREL
jgi:spore coat polysaccharide biosynthesis protein SpsF